MESWQKRVSVQGEETRQFQAQNLQAENLGKARGKEVRGEMDFEGLFLELAKQPAFAQKLEKRFSEFCELKQIPDAAKRNHAVTWNTAAEAGAAVLSEIVGEMLEKHPFLAKQAMKMMGGLG